MKFADALMSNKHRSTGESATWDQEATAEVTPKSFQL